MVQAAKGRRMGLIERLSSEITYFRGAIRTLRRVSAIARDSTHTVPDMLDDLAQKYADRTALIGGGRSYKYGMMNSRANQYAHWAQSIGIRHGDNISLMMGNCPEYVAVWLGIVRAGGCVALVNTHLAGRALVIPGGECHQFAPVRTQWWQGIQHRRDRSQPGRIQRRIVCGRAIPDDAERLAPAQGHAHQVARLQHHVGPHAIVIGPGQGQGQQHGHPVPGPVAVGGRWGFGMGCGIGHGATIYQAGAARR